MESERGDGQCPAFGANPQIARAKEDGSPWKTLMPATLAQRRAA